MIAVPSPCLSTSNYAGLKAEEETNKVSFLSFFPFYFAKFVRGEQVTIKSNKRRKLIKKREKGRHDDKNNNKSETRTTGVIKEGR